DNIDYDPALGKVILASRDSKIIFAINSDNKSWHWWNTGWKVRMVHSMNGRLVGASLYDGVVMQPTPEHGVVSEQARR
ncbi:MAG TPA: transcriptional regulator, partial [Acidobacteriaceae bacterium]|nr:transcriptional regulator [Acidobacteriaceae bacterium]